MKITIPNGPQERGKKPSVSSLTRYSACPGSWRLEKDLPEPPESEDAKSGTEIHAWLASQDCELTESQKEVADSCERQRKEIELSIVEERTVGTMAIRDSLRLWFGESWSGLCDYLDFLNDEAAFICDYKTGRVGAADAETNLQLRGQAVIVKKNFPHLKRIYSAIIQPLAGKPTMVCYTEEDLELATLEIEGIMLLLDSPEAELNPTPDGCKYCKAKSICPALREQSLELAQVSKKAIVSELSNRDISYYLKASKPVESFISELEKEAKKRLSEGQEIKGCELTPGRVTRAVTDAQAVFGRIGDKITTEAFVECCKLSLPSLEKAYATATGLRQKEAKDELQQTLSGLITETQGSPILKLK